MKDSNNQKKQNPADDRAVRGGIQKKGNGRVRRLTETGILLAVSVCLSFIKIIHMPLGGSVTLLSMLPLCVVCRRYGVRWGGFSCLCYGVIQMIFGICFDGLLAWGLSLPALVGCVLLDYIVAFTVLCLSGLFPDSAGGCIGAVCLGCFCRLVSHTLSGAVIFRNLAPFELLSRVFESSPWLYSVLYNGLFMLPECALTVVALVILQKVRAFSGFLRRQ